jgi:hypothetical protein
MFAFEFTLRCLQLDIVSGVFDTGGNFPPVSVTPVANLPLVSTTQAELVAKFAAGVADTGGAP